MKYDDINKYVLLIAGISLIVASYFATSFTIIEFNDSFFGFVPITDTKSLYHDISTAIGYGFGIWITYDALKKIFRSF